MPKYVRCLGQEDAAEPSVWLRNEGEAPAATSSLQGSGAQGQAWQGSGARVRHVGQFVLESLPANKIKGTPKPRLATIETNVPMKAVTSIINPKAKRGSCTPRSSSRYPQPRSIQIQLSRAFFVYV
jgi:hypothetical protein